MTLRKRQSSLLVSASRLFQSPRTGCAHGAPKDVASRTPFHLVAGMGSCQRKLPTGGCAYGMPRNSAPPEDLLTPRASPLAVPTTKLLSAGKASATWYKQRMRTVVTVVRTNAGSTPRSEHAIGFFIEISLDAAADNELPVISYSARFGLFHFL